MSKTISCPTCPTCECNRYIIIDGPKLKKSKYGQDIDVYLLECQTCKHRYRWEVPLNWSLKGQ